MINEIHFKDNEEILKALPDKSIDLILEDMPYNNTNLDFDYAVDLEKYWIERLRVIKDNGAIILTAQQPFVTEIINSQRKNFRYEIIWHKSNAQGFLDANRKPLRAHENILIFYKKQPIYNPQKTMSDTPSLRKNSKKGGRQYANFSNLEHHGHADCSRFPTSVLSVANWNGTHFGKKTKDATKHPTQKPIHLFRWIIRTYTNEQDVVFDGFAGSGTTAVACIMEKRNYICCEWNEEYFNNAKKRIEDAKLQKDFTLDL